MQQQRNRISADRNPQVAALERTRERVRELERSAARGDWGAKSELAREKRRLQQLLASL